MTEESLNGFAIISLVDKIAKEINIESLIDEFAGCEKSLKNWILVF